MRTVAERERRLARARIASRIEIGIGTIAVALPPLVHFFGPAMFSGEMLTHDHPWRSPVQVAAYFAIVVGYAWMLKLRFGGPEDGATSNWRSH